MAKPNKNFEQSNLEEIKINLEDNKIGLLDFLNLFYVNNSVQNATGIEKAQLFALWLSKNKLPDNQLNSLFKHNPKLKEFNAHEKAIAVSGWIKNNNLNIYELLEFISSLDITEVDDYLIIIEEWAKNIENIVYEDDLRGEFNQEPLVQAKPSQKDKILSIMRSLKVVEVTPSLTSKSKKPLTLHERIKMNKTLLKERDEQTNIKINNLRIQIEDEDYVSSQDFFALFEENPDLRTASFNDKIELFATWHNNPNNNISFRNLIKLIEKYFQTDSLDITKKVEHSLDKIAMIDCLLSKETNHDQFTYKEMMDAVCDFKNGILVGSVMNSETHLALKNIVLSSINQLVLTFLEREMAKISFKELVKILQNNPGAEIATADDCLQRILLWVQVNCDETKDDEISSLFSKNGLFSKYSEEEQSAAKRILYEEISRLKAAENPAASVNADPDNTMNLLPEQQQTKA